jgi:glycerol-3-phosphate acyltransferase PlsY
MNKMSQPLQISILILAYLIGSIPSAVWIGKIFYGVDVREYGSGNAGATNTFRVLGKKAGIPVLVMDILKGFAAVQLAYFSELVPGSVQFVNLQLVFGVASLFGHLFPVFASFKGGKGIATLLGIILAVHPCAALVSIAVFLIVFLISKYVSLGSITAAITFPIVVIVVFKTQIPSLVIFSMVIAVLVLITHRKNIERLLRREESKSRLIKKK